MASGFFLGGAAEGMETAEKQRLARETLATETGLRERGLGVQERGATVQEQAQRLSEKTAAHTMAQKDREVVDKHLAETMAQVSEGIKAGLAAGRDPEAIKKTVMPIAATAIPLWVRTGRDPAALEAQVNGMLAGPTQTEAVGATLASATATAQGKETGEGLGKIAAAKALAAAGIVDENAGFKDKAQRVTAEGALRDDYMKQSQPFVIARDFYKNFQSAEPTGAGDITRVFSFMKMLEPTSAVMPGEAANVNNAAGVPSWVMGQYNKLLGGGTLSEKARTELKGQVENLYARRGEQHDKLTTEFANQAKRYKMDVNNVVMDLGPTPKKGGDPGAIPAPPAGFSVVK